MALCAVSSGYEFVWFLGSIQSFHRTEGVYELRGEIELNDKSFTQPRPLTGGRGHEVCIYTHWESLALGEWSPNPSVTLVPKSMDRLD